MPYALREAMAAFRRAPLLVLLSVVAIAFSLFVVGLFALTAHNVRRALDDVEERVEVVVYLRDGTTEAQVRLAEEEVRAMPEVLSVRFISKFEAMATAMRELEEFREAFNELEGNPLPASLEIRLQPGQRTPAVVEAVATRAAVYPFVEDVRYGRDWLEKIVFIRRIAAGVAAALGASFALVAGIIIAAAIRIAVFARREEISIMRLVGATDGFIRRPFLLEGLMTGLLGGACAVALTFLVYEYVNRTLIAVAWLPASWTLAGIGVGIAFGFIASRVAVGRHLMQV